MAETRKLLLDAVNSGSPANLQAALKEFESKGLKDKGEYTKAKRKLLLTRLNKGNKKITKISFVSNRQ